MPSRMPSRTPSLIQSRTRPCSSAQGAASIAITCPGDEKGRVAAPSIRDTQTHTRARCSVIEPHGSRSGEGGAGKEGQAHPPPATGTGTHPRTHLSSQPPSQEPSRSWCAAGRGGKGGGRGGRRGRLPLPASRPTRDDDRQLRGSRASQRRSAPAAGGRRPGGPVAHAARRCVRARACARRRRNTVRFMTTSPADVVWAAAAGPGQAARPTRGARRPPRRSLAWALTVRPVRRDGCCSVRPGAARHWTARVRGTGQRGSCAVSAASQMPAAAAHPVRL